MFVILGASGHVGSAAAEALLAAGHPVTAVLHDAAKARAWEAKRATVAVVDVRDSSTLRSVFKTGRRAFLLNPPADTATDTDVEEHITASAIVAALEGSGLEKVVAESTMGAQAGERLGDLNVLYDFEQALAGQAIPAVVQRAGFYFSNYDAQLAEARKGTLTTLLPADLKLPMVAPQDLGKAAAGRLLEPVRDEPIHLVEGPQRYSPRDVAAAFAAALGRAVKVVETPRGEWIAAYRKQGFSPEAAESYSRMTGASIDDGFDDTDATEHGSVPLQAYVEALVARAPGDSLA